MDVLIIGGTRFVGYQLAWRLLAAGHRLTLVNRGTRPDPFGDRVERIVADRSTPAFARALDGRRFDAAVDFAAYTGDDARGAVQALGDGRLGHFILISTGQVYLVRRDYPRPAREPDYEGPTLAEPIDPLDRAEWIYGIDKRKAEDDLVEAWSTPSAISPFSGRWMSFLDPSLARQELAFRHEPVRAYLEKIVAVFINAPPDAPPENYARRAVEIELAAR